MTWWKVAKKEQWQKLSKPIIFLLRFFHPSQGSLGASHGYHCFPIPLSWIQLLHWLSRWRRARLFVHSLLAYCHNVCKNKRIPFQRDRFERLSYSDSETISGAKRPRLFCFNTGFYSMVKSSTPVMDFRYKPKLENLTLKNDLNYFKIPKQQILSSQYVCIICC